MQSIDKKALMKSAFYGGGISAATGQSGFEIKIIPLSEISDHHNHTFEVVDNEQMAGLVESFKLNTKIIDPIIVRESEQYGNPYECIEGHRRRFAAERAGRSSIEAIVLELTDEEADIWMVDSNLHSRKISLVEFCFSLAVRYDALKEASKAGDGRTDEALGSDLGMGRTTLHQYLALGTLNRELLLLVQAKKLTKEVGEVFAKLSSKSQEKLSAYFAITEEDGGKIPKISPDIAGGVLVLQERNSISPKILDELFGVSSAPITLPEKFKLTAKDLEGIFPHEYKGGNAEKKLLIQKLLTDYFALQDWQ